MKRFITVLLFVSISGLLSCSKSGHEKSEYPFIYLHDCLNKTFSNEQVELCFTSVVADNRCPSDVVCIWSGGAIANFKFTTKNGEHLLTLATSRVTPVYPPYSNDTLVDGYRIKFIDLHPYPLHNHTRRDSETKAEVSVTKEF